MFGTLSTALLHSSGTVASITTTLLGAGSVTICQRAHAIVDAHVGTCVVCNMIAFGQVGAHIQRAIAATVYDTYNVGP
ncbi:unnamed protein product [Phytophthora fragariaefolia]|uniref:Unnamed protein product n=1 Tax=Phytophthora fragariaefolia TaxID=1490495 RepID=A0A9W6YA95_9STRA|nr:unnamed protein product [Phytophthora fragariaefolia]